MLTAAADPTLAVAGLETYMPNPVMIYAPEYFINNACAVDHAQPFPVDGYTGYAVALPSDRPGT